MKSNIFLYCPLCFANQAHYHLRFPPFGRVFSQISAWLTPLFYSDLSSHVSLLELPSLTTPLEVSHTSLPPGPSTSIPLPCFIFSLWLSLLHGLCTCLSQPTQVRASTLLCSLLYLQSLKQCQVQGTWWLCDRCLVNEWTGTKLK